MNLHPAQPCPGPWYALGRGPTPGPEPDGAESENEIPLSNLTFTGENARSLPHLCSGRVLVDLLLCKVCISDAVQLSYRPEMCCALHRAAILKVPLSVHCNGVDAYL